MEPGAAERLRQIVARQSEEILAAVLKETKGDLREAYLLWQEVKRLAKGAE